VNLKEKKMHQILLELKEVYGIAGVKAEFEAEGTRIDELLRLLEITRKANLKFGIKIGGCEALKDLMDAKQIGCNYIIAPMVESDYACLKFATSINKIFTLEEKKDTIFLLNIETINALNSLDKILKIIIENKNVNGIVFGRSDFCLSKGLSKNDINKKEILKNVSFVAERCRENNLDFVVGGGISRDSINFLKHLIQIKLNRFETRKIIFNKECIKLKNLYKAFTLALKFEILYLQNKRDYYRGIVKEDKLRIQDLKKRWNI
jgi:hypothetical protein